MGFCRNSVASSVQEPEGYSEVPVRPSVSWAWESFNLFNQGHWLVPRPWAGCLEVESRP